MRFRAAILHEVNAQLRVSVEKRGQRTRAMSRKLRSVETLPEAEAAMLLGFDPDGELAPEEEMVAAQ